MYDGYGNLTTSATSASTQTTNVYDLGDRLLSITPASGNAASFTFDALGRFKTRAVTGSTTETYSYLGTTETAWRIVGATTTTCALDAAGSRTAESVAGTVGFLVFDLHGNVAGAETAAQTAYAAAIRYDPYGQTADTYTKPSGGIALAWKFQGRLDVSPDGSPLYDAGARFYAPYLGLFSQLDQVTGQPTDPRSMNRFAYAEANPWTFSDPSGHATCFSSSDLCDETMAIRHQGTAAARDAVRRSGSRTKVNHWYNRALKAKAPARIYETNPKGAPETASADEGWGEAASIAAAAAAGATAGKALRGYAYSDGQDGIAGVVKGVIGGVGDFAVGAVTTPIYAVTHLSDAATGLQCFVLDGCLQGAGHDLGWDKPVENLGKGWDTFVHMSDEEKASFATTVTLTGLTLRAGFRGMKSEPEFGATTRYVRPTQSTTAAQRAAVQGKPCVVCGNVSATMVADHPVPLVVEHLTTGTIDVDRMRSASGVQPMCPVCSAREGGFLSQWSRIVHEMLGL